MPRTPVEEMDRSEVAAELERTARRLSEYRAQLGRVSRLYPPDGWGHGMKVSERIDNVSDYRRRLHARARALEPRAEEELYEAPEFAQTLRLIVPDFTEITQELMEYFAGHPDELQHLQWRPFERLLEAVFRNQGFRTELGTGRNDDGVDLRLIEKDTIGRVVTLVQAKRYRSDRPVRLEAVQALSAVVDDQSANRGLLVTTSRFLPGAARFARRQRTRLVLATSEDVSKWCKHAAVMADGG